MALSSDVSPGASPEELNQYSVKLSALELRLDHDHDIQVGEGSNAPWRREVEEYKTASNDAIARERAYQYSVKLSACELKLNQDQETKAAQKPFSQNLLLDASASSRDSDIVELNVGGTLMSVTRATLLRAGQGSRLAAMFSGNGEHRHMRDPQGRIFLDANPYCFDMLLSFLRLKGFEDPDVPTALPQVAEDRTIEFATLAKYYAGPLFEPDGELKHGSSATTSSPDGDKC
ncbi:unnamed protein product [Prorocentrum cordatum]|uniref:Potassium channel tetramerisation-type BTB domain-containing protein n=1 Tax=Prorocentrum cordatum TaxID=2364126 RepID=A0ABN9RWT4_9DINO|nr:unnamed protein product [Polarella glacialis]